MRNKKGFTLIEMVVAIVIISILAALVVPFSFRYIKEYQDEKYIVDARKVYMEAQMFVVRKRVQYQVKSIRDSIRYDSCNWQGERDDQFQYAIEDIFDCEKKVTIYHVDRTSMELNDQFQLVEFKVDYEVGNQKIKTVQFDVEGNAQIFDSN